VGVLVISGPAGVGKTSVAFEVSLHLPAAEVGHAARRLLAAPAHGPLDWIVGRDAANPADGST